MGRKCQHLWDRGRREQEPPQECGKHMVMEQGGGSGGGREAQLHEVSNH